jgi:segregation and condensation protein B
MDLAARQTEQSMQRFEDCRKLEAVLFAHDRPLDREALKNYLPDIRDIEACLQDLQSFYQNRGIQLRRLAGGWAFRTAPDLASFLSHRQEVEKKLSKAALETLAIIAYHQPVSRADIEDMRGVNVSKGTLDILLDCEWIEPKGRRAVPGRPLTYGTTTAFLDHFNLASLSELPGLEDLKAIGLLEGQIPLNFVHPGQSPQTDPEQQEDHTEPC